MTRNPRKAGRDGPPHFTDKQGRLSIWVALCPLKAIPEGYFKEDYSDEDQPSTPFSEDFGFGFYGHDLVELNCSPDGPRPVRDLLAVHSYSASFLEAAAAEAHHKGVAATELVFVMYDFEYHPEVTGVGQSDSLLFLGCFDYDKDARGA
jgi:hypothetical protein